MENDQKKKKRGRPPGKSIPKSPFKYKKQYCEDLIKHMKIGKGYTTFTCYLGKTYGEKFAAPRYVLDEWVSEHLEFEIAKKQGEAYREAHWENTAIALCLGKLTTLKKKVTREDGSVEEEYIPARIPQAIIIFMLKTQFKESGYVERVELTGAEGGALTMAQIAKKAAEHKNKNQ
jgi:hypothetical protein